MNIKKYVCQNIYHMYGILLRELTPNGQPLTDPIKDSFHADPLITDHSLCRKLYSLLDPNEFSISIHVENSIFFYGLCNCDDHFYVLGPAVISPIDTAEKEYYIKIHSIPAVQEEFNIPQIQDFETFIKLAAFSLGLLCDKELEPSDFYERELNKISDMAVLQKNQISYKISSADAFAMHYSYQYEEEFWENFRNGVMDQEKTSITTLPDFFAGVFSHSKLKSIEYSIVSTITLATRHSIKAGVAPSLAYEISDSILQKISSTDNPLLMEAYTNTGINTFLEEIRKVKASDSDNHYIKKCQEYISRHIFEKLSLKDIAESLHVNASYLSHIFSENMHMPLTSYIQHEKILVSCNLLKYSNQPIPMIAEYVNLAPQSRFSTLFKKYMGISPAKYRIRNEDKNFKSPPVDS